MKDCKTCKQWNTYGSNMGECMKLLNWWQIKITTESTEEYGEYGKFWVDHPIERIDTDESFCCILWEAIQ